MSKSQIFSSGTQAVGVRPQFPSMSAVPYNTPTGTSRNVVRTSQAVQAITVQPTQLPSTLAVPYNIPTRTSQSVVHASQVVQAVIVQPTQLYSTSGAHPSVPAQNADIVVSSLSVVVAGNLSEKDLWKCLATLKDIIWGHNMFCSPC